MRPPESQLPQPPRGTTQKPPNPTPKRPRRPTRYLIALGPHHSRIIVFLAGVAPDDSYLLYLNEGFVYLENMNLNDGNTLKIEFVHAAVKHDKRKS